MLITWAPYTASLSRNAAPMSLGDHLNKAINDTLSRTILTSGSVFLVLLALLIFGGEVIRSFSWILLIGVVSGTYSTLYIVPAVAGAYEWLMDALNCFERAEHVRPPGNDDAILRCNSCVRVLRQHPNLQPAGETREEPQFLE